MNDIPIVFLTDKAYVVPTAVAICSLIDKYERKEQLEVYIIAANLSKKDIDKFRKMSTVYVNINIIEVDNSHTKKFDKEGHYITGTVVIKFDIGTT